MPRSKLETRRCYQDLSKTFFPYNFSLKKTPTRIQAFLERGGGVEAGNKRDGGMEGWREGGGYFKAVYSRRGSCPYTNMRVEDIYTPPGPP